MKFNIIWYSFYGEYCTNNNIRSWPSSLMSNDGFQWWWNVIRCHCSVLLRVIYHVKTRLLLSLVIKQSITRRRFEVLHRKCSQTTNRTLSLSELMHSGSFFPLRLTIAAVGKTTSGFWVASWQNMKKLLVYLFVSFLPLALLPPAPAKSSETLCAPAHLCRRSRLILHLRYLRKLLTYWRESACSQRSGRCSDKDWGLASEYQGECSVVCFKFEL